MTIDGPAGSGKTYTALRFAHVLANGGKIAGIDTERGSMSKYANESPDGFPWLFDVVEIANYSPDRYAELIQMAGKMGYSVLIIDSLSHAWEGVGGALETKDKVAATTRNNDYTAWRQVTPIHNRMIDSILQSPCHVITTMRSRMDYVQDLNEQGKVIGIRKVGMAPIQRPGMEYEFDIVADMDWSHIMTISKSRCSAIADRKVEKPGPEFMRPVIEWLQSGVEAPQMGDVPPTPATIIANGGAPSGEITFNDLLTKYGPEKVMQALINTTGGRMPSNSAEIQLIDESLTPGEAA